MLSFAPNSILELPRFSDMHVHLRETSQVPDLLGTSLPYVEHLLAMPNLSKPLTVASEVVRYRETIKLHLLPKMSGQILVPLYLTDQTTPMMIRDAFNLQVRTAKLYPAGATNNSTFGVRRLENIFPALETMAQLCMILQIHAEEPGADIMDRERIYVDRIFDEVVPRFPKLKIVFEHISTGYTAARVMNGIKVNASTIAASITAHHLLFSYNDMMGDHFRADLFCKPVLKTMEDRRQLLLAAFSCDPRFFLGSDSAPHPITEKGVHGCKPGVFTSPWLPSFLLEAYVGYHMRWQATHTEISDAFRFFTAWNGPDFYGLPRPTGTFKVRYLPEPQKHPGAWRGYLSPAHAHQFAVQQGEAE